MPERLAVTKTYKLYVNGGFPRSESGRSLIVSNPRGGVIAHAAHASRKDLRDAIEAAAAAQPRWAAATAYNRGQVLYRMAEMLEGKRDELMEALSAVASAAATPAEGKPGKNGSKKKAASINKPAARALNPRLAEQELDAAIDRLVCFAGWADKFAQALGCNNPVAGPYYNFTVPEPTGVVAAVAPDAPALLGLITLIAPPLCAGNAVVALASDVHPLPAAIFGEVCATSDVPPGVVNILTGRRGELLEHLAQHRAVDAIAAANLPAKQTQMLRLGVAENLKRVRVRDIDDWLAADACEHPWTIEPFVEMKTIWHPCAT